MAKYRALPVEATGLPWSTGIVHTAKCSVGGEINKDMFRRCNQCSHLICSKCFNRSGFKHKCTDGQALGPFPTHKQEAQIMALFDATIPPRDMSKSEKPAHNASWQWFPPSQALDKYPGVHMVGEDVVLNTGLTVNASAQIGSSSSHPVSNEQATQPPGSAIGGDGYEVSGYAEMMDLDAEDERVEGPAISLPVVLSTPEPVAKKRGRPRKRKVVSNDDHEEHALDVGGDEYKPGGSVLKSSAKSVRPEVRAKSTRTKRQPPRQDPPVEQENVNKDIKRSAPLSHGASLTNPTASENRAFKAAIRTMRTFEFDASNPVRITMYPGFFISDPNGAPGNILDESKPMSLPVAIGYQFRNSTTDKLVRKAIAVIQAPGGDADVPATATVADSYEPDRQGLPDDLHRVFERAIMGSSPYGDGEGMSRPLH